MVQDECPHTTEAQRRLGQASASGDVAIRLDPIDQRLVALGVVGWRHASERLSAPLSP